MRLRVSVNGRSYEVEVEVLEHPAPAKRLGGVRVERLTADGRAVVPASALVSSKAPVASTDGAPPRSPSSARAKQAEQPTVPSGARTRSRKSTVAGTWRGVGIGDAGELCAPVPGVVTEVHTQTGQALRAGQRLLTIEIASTYSTASPPLSGTVRALTTGILRKLCVKKGDAVAAGQVIAVVEE